MIALLSIVLASTALAVETPPDYLKEAQTCSRIDLRPALESSGFSLVRSRGGREDNLSFALSEMLGLELRSSVSARWLEHWIEDHEASSFPKLQTATRAILAGRLKPCLEDAVLSEDIESTRLARLRLLAETKADLNPSVLYLLNLFGSSAYAKASMTSYACKDSERVNVKPKPSLTLTESRSTDLIDRSLRASRLPVIFTDQTYAVVARRLSAASGVCEYLLRTYEGPTCDRSPCEDGSIWTEREVVAKSLAKVWSLEP